ncbi:MAG: glycyl-radical enzyme activating protein [Proteobacteria bacterium]|nr:glycyl-radical enzyme activating protein [Pseudomonadota bacterium]
MDRAEDMAALEGVVLEIQRMSTEDGPGIRTTVFFKGCTLACRWCHNPESISIAPQVQWIESRCLGCQTCVETCPNGALGFSEQGLVIDRGRCRGCGACVEACPSTAMELLGRTWTVEALVREVVKDRAYFEKSGGGVTASGGEATLQAEFAAAFLKACRDQGLHTALDTCGQCGESALERVLPAVDLVLFDLKIIDPESHRRYTGHGTERIHRSLFHLRDYMKTHAGPASLWIRTPVIPGATDSEANIRGIARFLADRLPGAVDRWELCSFNNLCRDKYTRLGLTWDFADRALMTAERMERLAEVARSSGVDPGIVNWSGATRLEQDRPEPPRLRLVKGGAEAPGSGESRGAS